MALPLPGPSAAILLIGEELLSGKVEDENARYLIRELRALGVLVRRIEIIPDTEEEIAAAVRALSARYDHVFTSGGVGATHDDVTLPAVARAFEMKLSRRSELETMIRMSFAGDFAERDLRMADVPEGAVLDWGPGGKPAAGLSGASTWPVVVVRNVYVLPGVPSIFRRKFALVKERFRTTPLHTRAVYSRESEGHIAGWLDQVVAAFPNVMVGSYPHVEAIGYKVKITLDGRDAAEVEAAVEKLKGLLGGAVVRSE